MCTTTLPSIQRHEHKIQKIVISYYSTITVKYKEIIMVNGSESSRARDHATLLQLLGDLEETEPNVGCGRIRLFYMIMVVVVLLVLLLDVVCGFLLLRGVVGY